MQRQSEAELVQEFEYYNRHPGQREKFKHEMRAQYEQCFDKNYPRDNVDNQMRPSPA